MRPTSPIVCFLQPASSNDASQKPAAPPPPPTLTKLTEPKSLPPIHKVTSRNVAVQEDDDDNEIINTPPPPPPRTLQPSSSSISVQSQQPPLSPRRERDLITSARAERLSSERSQQSDFATINVDTVSLADFKKISQEASRLCMHLIILGHHDLLLLRICARSVAWHARSGKRTSKPLVLSCCFQVSKLVQQVRRHMKSYNMRMTTEEIVAALKNDDRIELSNDFVSGSGSSILIERCMIV